jgi:hypothetical protein
MVFPVVSLIFLNKSIKILFPAGSKPEVGSSRTNMSGSIAKIPAIETLFFSPPDRL